MGYKNGSLTTYGSLIPSPALVIKAYFIYNFKKQCKVNYLNQSSNGNYIHIDNIDFPNFSGNAANFPNSKGPGPIPKKGCESPDGVNLRNEFNFLNVHGIMNTWVSCKVNVKPEEGLHVNFARDPKYS